MFFAAVKGAQVVEQKYQEMAAHPFFEDTALAHARGAILSETSRIASVRPRLCPFLCPLALRIQEIRTAIFGMPSEEPFGDRETAKKGCFAARLLREIAAMTAHPVPIKDASHLTLSVGRILFQNNADTDAVTCAVQRIAKVFGCDAHLLVTYEALLLTMDRDGEFRTKTGKRIPSMNVNMAAVAAVETLLDEVEAGPMALTEIRARLEAVEKQRPIYPRWIVVAGLGLTAASLSRLFGGDWPTFWVTLVAGMASTAFRLELGRRGVNLFLNAMLTAFVGGSIAGIAVALKLSTLPALCLITQGMILVPGVPFVNCVQDMIKNHMAIGISRLGLAVLITLAVAIGLFAATAVTGAEISVTEVSRLPSLAEDALFSACAALGYLFLFNVPWRLAWVGVLCGVASHTTRTFCLLHHMDIVAGSLIGALAAGFLAQGFARGFRAPSSAFAFPGVVAMIPGAFAFRAVIGYLAIINAGPASAPSLVAETLALSATSLFMVLAIAIGVAAPAILIKNSRA